MNLVEGKALWKAIEHIYDCIRQFNEASDSVQRTASVSSSLYDLRKLLETFFDPLTPKIICPVCEKGYYEITYEPSKTPYGDEMIWVFNVKMVCGNPNCKTELDGIVG